MLFVCAQVYVPMSQMQRFFYKRLLELNSGLLVGLGSTPETGSTKWARLTNLLMQLRNVATIRSCSPYAAAVLYAYRCVFGLVFLCLFYAVEQHLLCCLCISRTHTHTQRRTLRETLSLTPHH